VSKILTQKPLFEKKAEKEGNSLSKIFLEIIFQSKNT
jgi:hypothetical protein